MRVAVFGASSFIGNAFAQQCICAGYEVLAVSRQPVSMKNVTNYLLDFTKQQPIPSLKGYQAVFFFSRSYGRYFSQIADIYAVNVYGFAQVVEQAIRDNCSFIFHASTGSVYSASFDLLLEDSLVFPSNVYTASKLAAEKILNLSSSYINICNARIFMPFGQGQRGLPKILIEKIFSGEPIVLHPSPTGDENGLSISFLYIEDMVKILLDIMKLGVKGLVPSILNIAGPKAYSLRAFSEFLAKKFGRDVKFKVSSEVRTYDLIADISLLKSIVNPSFTEFTDDQLIML